MAADQSTADREKAAATRARALGYAIAKCKGPCDSDKYLLRAISSYTLDQLEATVTVLESGGEADVQIGRYEAAAASLSENQLVEKLQLYGYTVTKELADEPDTTRIASVFGGYDDPDDYGYMLSFTKRNVGLGYLHRELAERLYLEAVPPDDVFPVRPQLELVKK